MKVQLVLSIAVALGPAANQDPPPAAVPPADDVRTELEKRIEGIAAGAIEAGVPGLSIAVGKDSELWLSKGFGYADAGKGEVATGDTVYRVGTLARQLTVMGILQLVEAEKLKLEDELGKLLPEVPAAARKITLEHLLSGTSGIPPLKKLIGEDTSGATSQVRSQGPRVPAGGARPMDILARLEGIELEFAPGAGYASDSAGWLVLDLILERTSGQSLEDYVRVHIVEPLALEHTEHCSDDDRTIQVADDCKQLDAGRASEAPARTAAAIEGATRGLCSTAEDLFRWKSALFDRKLLGEDSTRRMTTSSELADGSPTNAGFGTSLGTLGELRMVGHTGGIGGYSVRVAHYPEVRATIVVLANCATAPVDDMEQAIARAMLGLLPAEVVDLPLEARDVVRCTGTYLVATTRVRIFEKNGKLWYEEPGAAAFALLHQGRQVFVSAADKKSRITFQGEEEKRAESFEILREGVTSTGKRAE